jgi:hypothetical protein
LKLYLVDKKTWVGTQADIKQIGGRDGAQIDVPTDKPGLLKFLNAMQSKIFALIEERDTALAGAGGPPVMMVPADLDVEAVAEPAKIVSAPIVKLNVVETIGASDGAEFANYLDAAISRLGELRATGWNSFAKLGSSDPRSRSAVERGLGCLVLEVARSERAGGDE